MLQTLFETTPPKLLACLNNNERLEAVPFSVRSVSPFSYYIITSQTLTIIENNPDKPDQNSTYDIINSCPDMDVGTSWDEAYFDLSLLLPE